MCRRHLASRARSSGHNERWVPQSCPEATSSTEVSLAAIGCGGLRVETCTGFPEARRVEMQRAVVELLLADIGVRPLPA